MVGTMAVEPQRDTPTGDLHTRLDHPGAAFGRRDGRLVATHYGSVATELAICRQGVGLADRADLQIFELSDEPVALVEALTYALGALPPAPGAARRLGRLCVIRDAPGHVLFVGRATHLTAWESEARSTMACVELIGPRAAAVLGAAGAEGPQEPDAVATFILAGAQVTSVATDADRYLILVDEGALPRVWPALLTVGRPHGIISVGCEALERLDAARHPNVAG
jgi:glycine cleavage system aminomethyltransferase T